MLLKIQVFFLSSLVVLLSGCSRPAYDPSLPDISKFPPIRGRTWARVITHLHTPFSWDGCDKKSKNQWVDKRCPKNQECIKNIRNALCENHAHAFFTDHPDQMAWSLFKDLLLYSEGDHLITKEGNPYINVLAACKDGFRAQVAVGFESGPGFISLGMKRHLDGATESLYDEKTREFKNRLQQEVGALVVIPHPENRDRSAEFIKTIEPNGMEIFNTHAILDPKIRKSDLQISAFSHIPGILTYLLDPYKQLNPDFAFLGFFEIHAKYFSIWNTYIYEKNKNLTGLVGHDSHENTFPEKVADGQRFDSVRRMTRFISNWILTSEQTIDSIKESLKEAQSALVVEGLGVPVGFDFSAQANNTTVGMGETLSLGSGAARFEVPLPTIMASRTSGSNTPRVRILIKKVLSDGKDITVAQSIGSALYYETNLPGAYRAELYIVPKHLKFHMGDFELKAENEYLWIVTNHLFLN